VRAQERVYSVRQLCSSLSVSESGYYKWKRNRSRQKAWQLLLAEIHKILAEHPDNENYGVERMMLALAQRGITRSYSTVKRAMKQGNLLHESHRSPDGLTKADKKADRPDNIVQQDFTASKPDTKWLTDITQVQCSDGILYIAPVLDCFRGEVISLAMDTNMKKELCIKAIRDAYELRNPGNGVIIHSDAGSQYTSRKYKKTLGAFHAIQSMSDVAKCYDNSRMESWFATLKKEKIYKLDTAHMTVEEVKKEVWRYTFAYYNTVRVTTVTEGGYPPSVYNGKEPMIRSVA
jgi:transposase InsO family protein